MAFSKKAWKDEPNESTPLNAEGLIDLEDRLSDYTDSEVKAEKEAREAADSAKASKAELEALDAEDVGAASTSELSSHASDTTSVHGIADTSQLATKSEVSAKQDASTAATDTELAAEKEAREEADASLKEEIEAVEGGEGGVTEKEVEEAVAAEAKAREEADAALGSAKESVSNKVQTLSGESESEYPSEKAVQAGLSGKASKTELSNHISDSSAAHAASAISYAGGTGMAATDVEAAVDELANEKENVANKSTSTSLGTSDTAYPSQKAVKGYVDGRAMVAVVHGSTAGTTRPSGALVVTWIGSVEPENALKNDILIQTE